MNGTFNVICRNKKEAAHEIRAGGFSLEELNGYAFLSFWFDIGNVLFKIDEEEYRVQDKFTKA